MGRPLIGDPWPGSQTHVNVAAINMEAPGGGETGIVAPIAGATGSGGSPAGAGGGDEGSGDIPGRGLVVDGMVCQKAGVDGAGREGRMAQHPGQKGQVRRQPEQDGALQR